MISHEKKFIFLHIPKTAGTSVGTMLYRNLDIYEPYQGFGIHHDDLTEEILQEYFVFTFVRNPWERLYSQYKFRGWMNNFVSFDFMAKNLKEAYKLRFEFDPEIKVPELSTAKERADWYGEFVHIPSQVEFLSGKYNDSINKFPYIDYIGRVENLNEDFRYICKHLGLRYNAIPHLNKSRTSTHFTEVYTEELKEFVANEYKDDIETFNYSYETI